MSRRYRRGAVDTHRSPYAEVNLINLVDVAFVLLVIFIITAPILQGGVEVALPRADVPPVTSQQDRLIISVTKEGKVFVERTEVSLEAFAQEFPQLLAGSRARFVHIQADQDARYADVLRVIAVVAKSEDIRFGLIAEPTGGR